MRLWTLHPRYLDRQGLVALWREGLLAQAVLSGKTKGYVKHPQIIRFGEHRSPVAMIATYLVQVRNEAVVRGYKFDGRRITRGRARKKVAAARGQLLYEWRHLRAKLKKRSPGHLDMFRGVKEPDPHPLFNIVPGSVEAWEKLR